MGNRDYVCPYINDECLKKSGQNSRIVCETSRHSGCSEFRKRQKLPALNYVPVDYIKIGDKK